MNGNDPVATYRLQLRAGFPFPAAEAILPYLDALGISHLYLSPILKARPGSAHGYDLVDHGAIDPELGGMEALERLAAFARARSMGLLVDLVANHMLVGPPENAWWMDVLENGPASPFAAFFDVEWALSTPGGRGRLLLPFLGDWYGDALDRGEIRLAFEPETGSLRARYFDLDFPLDPKTYPAVLERGLDALKERLGPEDPGLVELYAVIAGFDRLPSRLEADPAAREARHRDKEILRDRLRDLCARREEIRRHVREAAGAFNGKPGDPAGFDEIHDLLERQAWRLAFWQVASDEINYRRFFNINDLAALRMENPEVFRATHALVLELLSAGLVDGLRVDHPDGLLDPSAYFHALRDAARARGIAGPWIVAEKILAPGETLREDWPVDGTTGYEFMNLLHGLLVRPGAEAAFDRIAKRFTGEGVSFDAVVYEARKEVALSTLASELSRLASLLHRAAGTDRHTRDFTWLGLREALAETAACFPVYRTYVSSRGVEEEDRLRIREAVERARAMNRRIEPPILDFVRDALLLETPPATLAFACKFQQFTAPVAAKAVEDTAFYRYGRLLSLNEVGDDPRRFGVAPGDFHEECRRRRRVHPRSLSATSTHDAKRSEDVRARLAVLTEMEEAWRIHVMRWSRINHRRRRMLGNRRVPSKQEEYHLYQILAGVWPPGLPEAAGGDLLRRVRDYMIKALREAGLHSSWKQPDEAYEEAVADFVARLIAPPAGKNAFLLDFVPFVRRLATFGFLNSLTQTALKIASPGVPDVYQGSEVWDFSLVDPDNRRPVDFALRRDMLDDLARRWDDPARRPRLARETLDDLPDGRAKMFLLWRGLDMRRRHRRLFLEGEHLALAARGPRAGHVVALARTGPGGVAFCATGRWFHGLLGGEPGLPLGEAVWGSTVVPVPEGPGNGGFRNVLTGELLAPQETPAGKVLRARDLFARFPVSLLLQESGGGGGRGR